MRASSGDLKSSLSSSEHDEHNNIRKAVSHTGRLKHLSCFDESEFFLIDNTEGLDLSGCKDIIICSK